MNNSDPLAELRDIHLPDAVSWWPLAPGWWILIGLVLAALLAISVMLFLRSKRRRAIRLAQRQFAKAAKQQPDRDRLIENLQLFRRINLKYQPRPNVASLPLGALAQIICDTHALKIKPTTLSLLDDLQYQPDFNVSLIDWKYLMTDLGRLIDRLDRSTPIRAQSDGV